MKAAVVQAPGVVEVTSVTDPVPGARDVVVQVEACGICGTDLHILQGEFAPTLPVVPGHEFAGEVVAVGSEVHELALGAQVAVDPSLPPAAPRSSRSRRSPTVSCCRRASRPRTPH